MPSVDPMDPFIASMKHNQYSYRMRPMPALAQLHVARRLAPLLTALAPMLAAGGQKPAMPVLDMSMLEIIIDILTKMEDATVNYIMRECLLILERELPDGKGSVPVWNRAANIIQFEDLQGLDLIILTSFVVQENIGPFLSGVELNFGQAAPTP